MPRAPAKRYELNHLAVAPYQQVRGNFQSIYFAKVGMGAAVQAVGKKLADLWATKFAGWQADAVQDDTVGFDAGGPVVLIR